MKSMLDMNILVSKADGSKFEYKEFYDALHNAGFTWNGYFDLYHEEELEEVAKQIIDVIDDTIFNEMREDTFKDNPHFESESDYKEWLFMGLNSFYVTVIKHLPEKEKELLKKYTNTNWQVSDTFMGYVEGGFVNKFYNGEWL